MSVCLSAYLPVCLPASAREALRTAGRAVGVLLLLSTAPTVALSLWHRGAVGLFASAPVSPLVLFLATLVCLWSFTIGATHSSSCTDLSSDRPTLQHSPLINKVEKKQTNNTLLGWRLYLEQHDAQH
jgi:hypothetical protein